MEKLKIVHLFNFFGGSRFPGMISQGLYFHPDIEATYSMPVISLNSRLCSEDNNIGESLLRADYILRANDDHFGLKNIDAFLDQNDLWKKVIYYDFKDSPRIDYHRLETCFAYVKRSWCSGYDRKPLPVTEKPLMPLDYGMLSEYFIVPIPEQKDIDIAYLFPPKPMIGIRRYNVFKELDKARHHFANPFIGSPTAGAVEGRRAIFDSLEKNPFIEYLSLLKRSKIVFTAFPDTYDGDSRTWETFSSGALVFMDKTYIPSPHPFIHGIHCFTYDARDPVSIRDAIELARHYLSDDAARTEIAQCGLKHAASYHMPIDRINQVLKWVQAEPKNLEDHVKLV